MKRHLVRHYKLIPGTQLMFRGGFEYQTGTLDENGDPETLRVVGDI